MLNSMLTLYVMDILTDHHSIYIRIVTSQNLLSTFLIQFRPVYGLFGQRNMHSTLDFCPKPARRK
jgi:hypothetical protein